MICYPFKEKHIYLSFWSTVIEKTRSLPFANTLQWFQNMSFWLERKQSYVRLETYFKWAKLCNFPFSEPLLCLSHTALCFSEDAYKTQVRIDDEPAYLDILDTAGQVSSFPMWIIQSEIKPKSLTSGIWITKLETIFAI